jgi:anti-sigma factor RsiW
MSPPCRESDLDALLAGELSAQEAERVRAHAATCAGCTQSLTWLRMERGWMAQRARRMPARPALSFGALEARLRTATPRQGEGSHRGRMAMAAAAAVTFLLLSLVPKNPTQTLSEEPWGDGLVSMARVEACMDPSLEAVARVEARFGACLLASPAHPLR